MLHALDLLPEADAILLLQPTSPLRTTEDIDACLVFAREHQAVSVASVSVPATHPYWMYRLESDESLVPLIDTPMIACRQDLPSIYAMNGALYYGESSWLRKHRTFVTNRTLGFIMPPQRSVDLDTPLDWRLAELLLGERK